MDDKLAKDVTALLTLMEQVRTPLLARRDALRAELTQVETALANMRVLPPTAPPAPPPTRTVSGSIRSMVLQVLRAKADWMATNDVIRGVATILREGGNTAPRNTIMATLSHLTAKGSLERHGWPGHYKYRVAP